MSTPPRMVVRQDCKERAVVLKKPPTLPAPGAQGQQGQAVAGEGHENIGQGIHERDPGHPEFPVYGGGDIDVDPEGKAGVDGAQLRQPGHQVARGQEGQGAAEAQLPGGQHQVAGQKEKNIGPQQQRAPREDSGNASRFPVSGFRFSVS